VSAVIDAPTVIWEPAVPRRRPRLWPTSVGLAVTALVVAGGFAVVISGLRVRYTERAGECAAVDAAPIATLLGKGVLKPLPDGDECLGAVGDDRLNPVAVVRLTITYHDSTFEARLSYEQESDTDVAAQAPMTGKRGLVWSSRPPLARDCVLNAEMQDVNLTMSGRLTLGGAADPCDPRGRAARALAATMRQTLAKLG
jgi:hypothetical protein